MKLSGSGCELMIPDGELLPLKEILCLGPVTHLEQVPDLARFGWRDRRPLDNAIHRERLR